MKTELEKLKENTFKLIDCFEVARHQVIEIYKHNAMLVKIIRKYIPHKTITELIDEYRNTDRRSTQADTTCSGVVLDGMDRQQKDRQKRRTNRKE